MCPSPEEPQDLFPAQIKVADEIFTREIGESKLSGLNPKAIYKTSSNKSFILKIEKERTEEGVFKNSVKKENQIAFFQTLKRRERRKSVHLLDARKDITFMAVLASKIAKKLFPGFIIPNNILCCLADGTPAILSEILPNKLNEFLSEKEVIKNKEKTVQKDMKIMGPSDWDMQLQTRELQLEDEEAYILGKLYYAALLMGHWDLFNNINLSNSGSGLENGIVKPCIVDWGNCLGVGFGGVSQDATAFNNPEFAHLNLDADNPITGFQGAVPFDKTVYPKLPRQLVSDLFNHLSLLNPDPLYKNMLKGFFEQHEETKCQRSKIAEIVISARDSILASDTSFEDVLCADLLFKGVGTYEKNNEGQLIRAASPSHPELIAILDARVDSLNGIIKALKAGQTIQEISEERFRIIEASQTYVI